MARSPTRGQIALSPSGNDYRGEFALSSPPSSPAIVLCWDQSKEDWVPSEITGGGGTIPPLSTVFYVDSGTLVAAPDQDGSIAAPYSDLLEAIELKSSDEFTNTLLVVPRDDSYGDILIADGKAITLQGLGGPGVARAVIGNINIGAGSVLGIAQMITGDVTLGIGASLSLKDEFNVGVVSAPGGSASATLSSFGSASSNSGQGPASVIASIAGGDETGNVICNLTNTTITGGSDIAVDSSLVNCYVIGGIRAWGDLELDLFTASTARLNSATITCETGLPVIIDALTRVIEANVNDVSGAPTVVYLVRSFPGAEPGDTFAISISGADAPPPPVGLMYGVPYCLANDTIGIPVTILEGADALSVDLTVTRFSVSGLQSSNP